MKTNNAIATPHRRNRHRLDIDISRIAPHRAPDIFTARLGLLETIL